MQVSHLYTYKYINKYHRHQEGDTNTSSGQSWPLALMPCGLRGNSIAKFNSSQSRSGETSWEAPVHSLPSLWAPAVSQRPAGCSFCCRTKSLKAAWKWRELKPGCRNSEALSWERKRFSPPSKMHSAISWEMIKISLDLLNEFPQAGAPDSIFFRPLRAWWLNP